MQCNSFVEVAAHYRQYISAAMNASGKVSEINSNCMKKRTCRNFFYIPKSNLPVYCQACVCLSHTHAVCMQVYVWGEIPQLQNNAKTPMETNLQSLDEVFSVYGDGTMYKALKIGICTTFILDTLIIFKLNIIILHNT